MDYREKQYLFRFETLEIREEAIRIAMILFDIADLMEQKKLWRFADQIRGVGMSIPNNISDSTGSDMVKDQQNCLRSCQYPGNATIEKSHNIRIKNRYLHQIEYTFKTDTALF